jgi:hypothetical protein
MLSIEITSDNKKYATKVRIMRATFLLLKFNILVGKILGISR